MANIFKERLYQYALLMRLDKPIGILLLLWPTLWALWIASGGEPDIKILIVFISGVVLMRSAGCVINDVADRKIDAHVARTKNRPLARGRVTTTEALLLCGILTLTAFLLVLLLNGLTILLSLGAVLLAAIYPFMKRYTYLPQVFLGAAFAWSIPMAFAAQTGTVPSEAWLLFIANVIWTVAYDTMYAMVDRADDIRIGVRSTAILFADADRSIIAMLHIIALGTLLIVGFELDRRMYYFLGLLAAAGLAIYQQYLIKDRDERLCFKAFIKSNWFGFAVFAGIALDYHFAV